MFRHFAAILVMGSAVGVAQAQYPGADPDDFAKAFALAQQQVPGGQLMVGRFETGQPLGDRFGFYFWLENRIVEIEIGLSGQTLKKKEEPAPENPTIPRRPRIITEEVDPEPNKPVSPDVVKLIRGNANSRFKIPPGRLMEIAKEQLKDTPLNELKYEVGKDGKLVARIGNKIVNTETGELEPAN